jgi:hypothetical protein
VKLLSYKQGITETHPRKDKGLGAGKIVTSDQEGDPGAGFETFLTLKIKNNLQIWSREELTITSIRPTLDPPEAVLKESLERFPNKKITRNVLKVRRP